MTMDGERRERSRRINLSGLKGRGGREKGRNIAREIRGAF
jgi:hypothetical protein